MDDKLNKYIDGLKAVVRSKLESFLSTDSIAERSRRLFERQFQDDGAVEFADYYSRITGKYETILGEKSFFATFKQKYQLQGIDRTTLSNFDAKKKALVNLARTDAVYDLYVGHFQNVRVRHGGGFRRKGLRSFFTKFVHTISPDKYCALDNPIKDYFDLKHESFYISFIILSSEYRKWCSSHATDLVTMRKELSQVRNAPSSVSKWTDVKLLDLIFWELANNGEVD